MKSVQVLNLTRGAVLGTRVAVADRWWLRLRGLVGRPRLRPGEGMLLVPCSAVHMHGVHYPLDVAFLAADGGVIAAYPELPPGERSRWHRRAWYALELPAGTLRCTGTEQGDIVAWTAPPPSGPETSDPATPEPAP